MKREVIRCYLDMTELNNLIQSEYNVISGCAIDIRKVIKFMNDYGVNNINSLKVHGPHIVKTGDDMLCIIPPRISLDVNIKGKGYQERSLYYTDFQVPKVSTINIYKFFINGDENKLIVHDEEDLDFFDTLPDDAIITWEYDGTWFHQVLKQDIDTIDIFYESKPSAYNQLISMGWNLPDDTQTWWDNEYIFFRVSDEDDVTGYIVQINPKTGEFRSKGNGNGCFWTEWEK